MLLKYRRYLLVVCIILLVVLIAKYFTGIGLISTQEADVQKYERVKDDADGVRIISASIYPNTSKGFILASIDAMEVSKKEKDTMREDLHYSTEDAKSLLAALASRSNDLELKKLSDNYQKRLPGAMIIGCKKCGTTFFETALIEHSTVAMKRLEAHYFDGEMRGIELYKYRSQMVYSFPDQLTMEKTPKYWVTDSAPQNIHLMNPNIKLILLVREPACRVASDYFHEVKYRNIKTSISFIDVLTKPEYDYHREFLLFPSLYDIHMKNWLRSFPMEQIMIIKNEDLLTTKLSGILRDVEKYLGLNHELDVLLDDMNMCIVNHAGSEKICFVKDEQGICKYDEEFGPYLEDLRKVLQPHISNFEKIVNRTFNWY